MLQGYLHNGFATRTRSHNHIQSLPLCSKYRPQLSISISSRVFQPGGEEPMPRIGQFRRTTQYNSLSALLAALTSSPFPRQPTSISLALSAIYLCGKQQLLLLLVTFPSPDRPDISSRIASCTSGVKRGDTVRALYHRDSECREYSANPSISWDVHRKRRTRPCTRNVPVRSLSRRRTKPSSLGKPFRSFPSERSFIPWKTLYLWLLSCL